MFHTIDANVILRSIIDNECEKSYLKICKERKSFLCFSVNREVNKKQIAINQFLISFLIFLENREGINKISKRNFYRTFSNKFTEIFKEIKDVSKNFSDLKKLKDIQYKQENFISLRKTILLHNLYPKSKEELERILKKEIVKEKFDKADKIPGNDRIHLCVSEEYSLKKIDQSFFVTSDEKHLLKNGKYLEDIFKSLKITDPKGYNLGGEF